MLNNLRRQTVTLYTSSTKDRYGRQSHGSGTDYKVRVNEKTKNIFKPNGEVITIHANCYFSPDVTIDIDDKVTYNSIDYKVFSKKIARNEQGVAHHTKVELVKWQV